jgi:hypothetical protein
MRTQTLLISIATMVFLLAPATPRAATLSGSVDVGQVFLDEVGDLSTVQETYNLYQGFTLGRIHLLGTLDPRNTFTLDLRDVNRDSRTGEFTYRVRDRFKLRAGYDQSRYVFDPGRGVTSDRKDGQLGFQYTPSKALALSGDFSHLRRTGDRLSYPTGTVSVLGDSYDNAFTSGQLTADVRYGRNGGGVSFRMSDYSDDLNPVADRQGWVAAARLYAPMPFYDKWNNLFRGSYGIRQLKDGDLDYKLSSFQYTAIVQPRSAFEFRYAFLASRVDDASTKLMTDRFVNDLDATWFHKYGRVNAGYGYEMNDDDRTLTTYRTWRAGTTFRPERRLTFRLDYANRVKKDQEELTLLKDIDASRVRAELEVRPVERLTISGDYTKRERDLPDIQVSVDGEMTGAVARYELLGWGALSADYSHSTEHYVDLLAGFDTQSDVVTARVEVGRIKNLRLAGGVTYLDIGKDLDIEKSMVFVEGALRVAQRYRLEAKYNCYNYDDYILIDRYYTANVVRVSLGYDL